MSDVFGGWKVHILKHGLRQSKWIELSNVSSCWNRWPFHSFLVVHMQTSKVEWESAWRKWMLYVRPTKFVIEHLFKIHKYHVQLLSMISSSVRARQEVDGFLWLLNPQMWTYHVSTDTDRVTGVKEPPTSIQVSLGTKDSPITAWRAWAATVQLKTHIEWNVSGDLFFFGTFSQYGMDFLSESTHTFVATSYMNTFKWCKKVYWLLTN